MKKRRLLAVFAAFAVAATMAIGVTACGDKENNNDNSGDNQQTEQPDSGNNNNTEPGNTDPENPEGADDSVLTEEQWIKAFADTMAATNYKLVNTITVSGEVYGEHETASGEVYGEAGEWVSYTEKLSYTYHHDGAGLKEYSEGEEIGIFGVDAPLVFSGCGYSEVFGNVINRYFNDCDDEGWVFTSQKFNSENDAKENFYFYAPMNDTFDGGATGFWEEYSGIGDNEEITGTLGELYNLFSYDSQTRVYSATLNAYASEIHIQISFKNGKVYKLISDYVDHIEGWPDEVFHTEVTITDYGEVSVTIPEEVKQSAKREDY